MTRRFAAFWVIFCLACPDTKNTDATDSPADAATDASSPDITSSTDARAMDATSTDSATGTDANAGLDAASGTDLGTAPGTLLFSEDFEDTNFESRGWYDAPSGALSSTEHIPGSSHSFECRFEQGATGCTGGAMARHLFTETESVYVSYWVKYSANYVGSGQPYHPHEFYLLTNKDHQWVGPACSHLTLYIEQVGGAARLAMQDAENVDTSCILRNDNASVGCNGGSVADYTFSEQRSAASCNGLVGDYDSRDCFPYCSAYYSAKAWGPELTNKTFSDDPNDPHYKNLWHHIEVYYELNSIVNGVGVADGKVRYLFDGETIISYDQVLLRTGAHPDMRINQFLVAPYIGDGSPVDQTMWVDDLVVATAPL